MFVSRQGTTYEIANRIAPSIVDVLASYGAIRSTISPNAWFADFSMVHFFKDGYAKEFFNSICYLFGAMVERIAPYGCIKAPNRVPPMAHRFRDVGHGVRHAHPIELTCVM